MKTILLFGFLMFSFWGVVVAQNNLYVDNGPWAPVGATWIYQIGNVPEHMAIRVAGDSTILNQPVKQLHVYSIYDSLRRVDGMVDNIYMRLVGKEYQYNSNDSVYMYDSSLDKFVFLYHSYPQAGDVWNLKTSYTDCFYNYSDSLESAVEIEDTLVYVNGIAYQAYNAKRNSKLIYEHIIPNIGSQKSFHPQYNTDSCAFVQNKYIHYNYTGLVCYTDDIRGKLIIKTYENTSYDWLYNDICDAIKNKLDDYIVSVEKPTLAANKNDKFSIYPNPAQSHLNVFSNGVFIKEIVIYDAVGRLVIQDKSQADNINISMLNSGLYIINILDEKNEISAFKFVKE